MGDPLGFMSVAFVGCLVSVFMAMVTLSIGDMLGASVYAGIAALIVIMVGAVCTVEIDMWLWRKGRT